MMHANELDGPSGFAGWMVMDRLYRSSWRGDVGKPAAPERPLLCLARGYSAMLMRLEVLRLGSVYLERHLRRGMGTSQFTVSPGLTGSEHGNKRLPRRNTGDQGAPAWS